MKKHIANYLKHYNIGEQDTVLCEVCGAVAQDIHHVIYKSQGGSDEVDNLIALCRKDHLAAHNNQITKKELYEYKNQGSFRE